MLRNQLLVDEETLNNLNPEVLDDVASCLWPRDCQTCGWSLGNEPCALVVDDTIVFAYATLHHKKCRAPSWNDSGSHQYTSGPLLSWVANGVILPVGDGSDPMTNIPGLVLNPSLEMVSLNRGSEGKWQLNTLHLFREMGFKSSRQGIDLGKPVPRSNIIMTPTSWRAYLPGGLEVYEAGPAPHMNKLAMRRKGILVIITQAADPGNLTMELMNAAMLSRHTVAGWVPLQE